MKMVPIISVKTVYCRVCPKVSLVIYEKKFINVNMYSQGRDKILNLMNRFLHEFLDLTPAIF